MHKDKLSKGTKKVPKKERDRQINKQMKYQTNRQNNIQKDRTIEIYEGSVLFITIKTRINY